MLKSVLKQCVNTQCCILNESSATGSDPEESRGRASIAALSRLHSAQRSYRARPRWSLQSFKSSPATLKYEPGLIVADGDFVIVHGRFSGLGRPKSWIAADILRIVDRVLVEHWDVLQDEASQAESKSDLPMFGGSFTE